MAKEITSRHVRIGTRGTASALAQARAAGDLFAETFRLSSAAVEIVPLTTRGDDLPPRPLAELGGKAVFTEELAAALRAGEIDFAVHHLKDLPPSDAEDLVIAAILPRLDARDALLLPPKSQISALTDLPPSATVATGSRRRRAQILRLRPDIKVAALHGDSAARRAAMRARGLAAAIVSQARLIHGGDTEAAAVLPLEDFLPAAGQGAVALQCRADNYEIQVMLTALADIETTICTAAERAFVARLTGAARLEDSTKLAIGAHASLGGGQLRLRGEVLSADGAPAAPAEMKIAMTKSERADVTLGVARAANLGDQMADMLAAEHPELLAG